MQFEAIPYLLNSLSIIRKNFFPLFLLLAASAISFIPIIQNSSNISYFFLSLILIFFLYPSVYGQYTEITLRNRKISYIVLFKRHCLNFIIVSLILVLPIIFLSLLRLMFEINFTSLRIIYSILLSSLSIYILPLLFIHGKRWESIKIGFQCIAGNLNFNLPFIIIAFLTTTFTFIFAQLGNSINTLMVYGFISLFGLIVEFWFFVAALLILKDKGLAEGYG